MKRPNRLALAALLGVPVAFFFVARRVAKERPARILSRGQCDSLAFSPDGRVLWVGTTGGEKFYFWTQWDVKTLSSIRRVKRSELLLFSQNTPQYARIEAWEAEPSPMKDRVAFSPEIFIGSTPRTEYHFSDPNVEDDDVDDFVEDAKWKSNEQEIVVATTKQIRRFSMKTRKMLFCASFRVAPSNAQESGAALSPDGRFLARASTLSAKGVAITGKASIVLYDTNHRHAVRRISLPRTTDLSESIGWSPKGNILWAETDDFMADGVLFVRASDGQFLWKWNGLHNNNTARLKFSPDEKFVVACNGTACVARNAQTGRELWRLKAPNSPIFALSPDGKTLAEARQSGQILLWPLPQTS